MYLDQQIHAGAACLEFAFLPCLCFQPKQHVKGDNNKLADSQTSKQTLLYNILATHSGRWFTKCKAQEVFDITRLFIVYSRSSYQSN